MMDSVQSPFPTAYLYVQMSEAVNAFQPELLIISVGVDAHLHGSGLGKLSAQDFYSLVQRLKALADCYCMGRIVVFMGGIQSFKATGLPGSEEETESNGMDDVPSAESARNEGAAECVIAICRALAGLPSV